MDIYELYMGCEGGDGVRAVHAHGETSMGLL